MLVFCSSVCLELVLGLLLPYNHNNTSCPKTVVLLKVLVNCFSSESFPAVTILTTNIDSIFADQTEPSDMGSPQAEVPHSLCTMCVCVCVRLCYQDSRRRQLVSCFSSLNNEDILKAIFLLFIVARFDL